MRFSRSTRREFITLLVGAAVWPLAGRAQQGERMRRIGVLLPAAADDPVFQTRLAAFHQGLALSGWTIGRNVRMDVRWATANAAEIRRHAAELAALAPDVILATGDSTMPPLLQATRTVPIVFPVVTDPVGAGKHQEFAMDPGCPPLWVFPAHPADEITQITIDLGPPCPLPRFPAPECCTAAHPKTRRLQAGVVT